jgi:hypothetical protein
VGSAPAAPSSPLTAVLQSGPQISLTWADNATNENGFVIERAVNGGAFSQIATAPARSNTGNVTFIDNTIAASAANATYSYRVAAVNPAGYSSYATSAPVLVPALPLTPSGFTVTNGLNSGNSRSIILKWTDNSSNETGFTIQRATNATFTQGLNTVTVGSNVVTLTQTGLARNTQYWYRIRANNGTIIFTVWVNAAPFPIRTNP